MIDTNTLAQLRHIGLTPAILQAIANDPNLQDEDHTNTNTNTNTNTAHASDHTPPPPLQQQLLRVVEVQREHLLLHDGLASHRARALPRLLAGLHDEADALAVGDWVLARADTHGDLWVHQRLPPTSQITRRQHDGRDKVVRTVIVSNVDTALLTMGLDADFNLRRLERYATLVRLAGVQAVVLLTKADQCANPAECQTRLQAVRERLGTEVPVLAVDSHSPQAAQALAPWLGAGRTLVLLGASGAGKSTLTNTLCGGELQATGATRSGDGRGRHTTTVRSLHRTLLGACIIDTPGLRTWRLDTDEAALDGVFSDVSSLAGQCRFRDCRHQGEPGCAVQGGVPPDRLRHFHKLRREAERDTMSVLERQRQLSEWKVRGRAGKARADAKRG
jgi:ribosome biogenesis GTPase